MISDKSKSDDKTELSKIWVVFINPVGRFPGIRLDVWIVPFDWILFLINKFLNLTESLPRSNKLSKPGIIVPFTCN